MVFDRFMERAKTMTGDYNRRAPAVMMETSADEDQLFALDYSPRRGVLAADGRGVRHADLHFVPTERRLVPSTRPDGRPLRPWRHAAATPTGEVWANCFASVVHPLRQVQIATRSGSTT
jgi:hypothetical protein